MNLRRNKRRAVFHYRTGRWSRCIRWFGWIGWVGYRVGIRSWGRTERDERLNIFISVIQRDRALRSVKRQYVIVGVGGAASVTDGRHGRWRLHYIGIEANKTIPVVVVILGLA